MQAMHRGNTARKTVKRLKAARRRASERQHAAMVQSCALARQIMPEYIAAGVKKAISELSSINFKIALNLSGILTVVTISAAARQAKRSPVLCSSCSNRLKRGDRGKNYPRIPHTGDNSNTVGVTYRDSLSFMQNGVISYQAHKGLHTERDMCTCTWSHSEEQWLLSFFEPLTGELVRKTIRMSEVQGNIEEVIRARSTMYDRKSERKRRLQGADYGNLEPLFFGSDVAFDGRLDKSYNYARREAARVNAILPLLPKIGGDIITNDVIYAIRSRRSLPVDRLRSTRIGQSTSTTTIRTNMDQLELSKPIPSGTPGVFEPMADLLYSLRHIRRVKHHADSLQEMIETRKDTLRCRELEIAEFMETQSEKVPMQYEDARSRFLRTDGQLQEAKAKIVAIMRYHKANIHSYEEQERNTQEDWAQDYDKIENGSAWRGLNDSRKLEVRWNSDKDAYHSYCALCPPLIPLQKEMERKVVLARQDVAYAQKAAVKYAPVLAEVAGVYNQVNKLTRTTIAASLAPWAMPRKVRACLSCL